MAKEKSWIEKGATGTPDKKAAERRIKATGSVFGSMTEKKSKRTTSDGYMPKRAPKVNKEDREHAKLMKTDRDYAYQYRQGLQEEANGKETDRMSKKK